MSQKPRISNEEFARVWNDVETYPTVRSIASLLGYGYQASKNRARKMKKAHEADGKSTPYLIDRSQVSMPVLPETLYQFKDMSVGELTDILKGIYLADPTKEITRLRFRNETGMSDASWSRHFGTFLEFKRQAGIQLNRSQHKLERDLAKHVSVDHYRDFNERQDLGTRYLRDSGSHIKTIIGMSDLHDEEIDPFFLRVALEAVKMVKPDVINLGGDIFDLAEFGKYGVDPREWDVVGKIKFVHDNILRPLREASPESQIDFIEGNNEFRLLRHLADATPALRAILSDLHGFTIPKLLGLDEFEVNYISKADLSAFNKGDMKKEVGKSYKVYWDSLLIHHHPFAAQWGLPGWNGHHHSHKTSTFKSAVRGAYKWLALGAGHMPRASYTNGEFWDMGFNIAHVNTRTGAVNNEYVYVTDMACVGGRYFYRQPHEFIGALASVS